MPSIISGNLYQALRFFNTKTFLPESVGMKALCLVRDDVVVASTIYEGFNGKNVWVHLAADESKRWMTKSYLHYCFHYPFNEMGVDRLSGYVNSDNYDAIRLNEHLGYKREAILKGASPTGLDVIIYVMWRQDCRFLRKG